MNENINDINTYIETTVENKINSMMDTIIDKNDKKNENKMIYEYTIHELYINTLQYLIDIINDISDFLSINHKNETNEEYRKKLFNIFFQDDRILYTGIILIFLSLILYFIDGIST